MATFTVNTTYTFRSVAITTDRDGNLKASEPSRGGEVLPDGWQGKCVLVARGEGMIQLEDGRVLRTDKNKIQGSEQAAKYLTHAAKPATGTKGMTAEQKVAAAQAALEAATKELTEAKAARAKLYADLKAEFEAEEQAAS